MPSDTKPATKVRYLVYLLMASIYLALGVLFLFTTIGIEKFPVYRSEVGIVFLAYASFRFYTSYKKFKL